MFIHPYHSISTAWSHKGHLNYKNSISPDQIRYQIQIQVSLITIPDKLSVNTLMKPAYDDVMTV